MDREVDTVLGEVSRFDGSSCFMPQRTSIASVTPFLCGSMTKSLWVVLHMACLGRSESRLLYWSQVALISDSGHTWILKAFLCRILVQASLADVFLSRKRPSH